MRYAHTSNKEIIDATKIRTPEERRSKDYYCIECFQEVTFSFLQHGVNYFSHKEGHIQCVLSSELSYGNRKKEDKSEYLAIRTRLTDTFQKLNIPNISRLHWESEDTSYWLLPFTFSERRLIKINKETQKRLVCLIPRIITDEDRAKIRRFGNFRYKVRAVNRYAFDNSNPKRHTLTNGKCIFDLSAPEIVWRKGMPVKTKTLYDYQFKELNIEAYLDLLLKDEDYQEKMPFSNFLRLLQGVD